MIKIVLDPEGPNEITLKLSNSLFSPNGDIQEYDIFVNGMRVYGRRVTIKEFQDDTRVYVPRGWWWEDSFPKPQLPIETAIKIAVQEEQQKQPNVTDLEGRFIETVLWPEGAPWQVVHQVEVTSERGMGATYFIDAAHDGAVVHRRQVFRMQMKKIITESGVVIFVLEGPMTERTSHELRGELNRGIDEIPHTTKPKVVLNLKKVNSMDSTGLGILKTILNNVQKRGGRLALAELDRSVENLLVLTNLARFFSIYKTNEEAVRVLQGE